MKTMALAMSPSTLFLFSFLFLHFSSPALAHRPIPAAHPAGPAPGSPPFNEICSHTRDPDFCKRLNMGDISSIKKVDDIGSTVMIYDSAHDIAAVAKTHISKDVNCVNVKAELKGALGICLDSYAQAIGSLSCTSPTPESMDASFKKVEQSIWTCRQAVDKLGDNDLSIAYVKAANHLVHHLITIGSVITTYKLHPTPPLSEHF